METRSSTQTRKTTKASKSQSLKIRRQYEFDYTGTYDESTTLPSKTVPDMNLSIKELLINHSRGINSTVHENQGEYFDAEIPQFDDITEEIEYKNNLQLTLDDAIAKAEEEIKTNSFKRTEKSKKAKIKAIQDAKDLLEETNPTSEEKE